MIQFLLLAQSMNKSSVRFHVLVVSIDRIVEVGLDLEEQAKVRISDVERLV